MSETKISINGCLKIKIRVKNVQIEIYNSTFSVHLTTILPPPLPRLLSLIDLILGGIDG